MSPKQPKLYKIVAIGTMEDPKFRAAWDSASEVKRHTLQRFIEKEPELETVEPPKSVTVAPNPATKPREKRKTGTRFYHKSGKTVGDFIMEHVKLKNTVTKAELRRHITAIGYSPSSLESKLSHLKEAGKVEVYQGLVSLPKSK